MPDAPKAIEDRERYLHLDNLPKAGEFVRGLLWADFKRVLLARRPVAAEVTDPPHVAAAKGFRISAWNDLIEMIERLPFEAPPEGPASPYPAEILDPRD